MSTVIAGSGLGLFNGSLSQLGGFGGQGSPRVGTGTDRVYVNASTGNLVIQSQDDYLASLGLDAAMVRTYNSLGLVDGDNGDNWQTTFYRRLQNLPAVGVTTPITRVNGDGHQAVFTWDAGKSAWISTDGDGAHDTLTRSGSNWVYKDTSRQVTETYDSTGKLISSTDQDGNALSYGYNPSNLVTSVTTASGNAVYLDYGGANGTNLTQVRTVVGGQTTTRVRYAYDGQNRLTQVKVDLGNITDATADDLDADANTKTYVTNYEYTGTTDRRISRITQSDGSELKIGYVQVGSDYRVASLQQLVGAGVYRTTTFNYDTANNRTSVQDPAGNVSSFKYDAQGRLTKWVSPADETGALSVYDYQYNASGDISQVKTTTGAGAPRTVNYLYNNGNLTESKDDRGNTVRRTYNAADQIETETRYTLSTPGGEPQGAQTTRYVYDPEQHLRFVISPEGRVTENQYNTNGTLKSTIRYTGHLYQTATYNDDALSIWAAGAPKTQGERVDFTYDVRGQLATSKRFTSLDSNGAGVAAGSATTTYVYNAAGQLLQVIDPRNAAYTTTYTYDGLGRVLTTTDATGRITSSSYDDVNNKIVLTQDKLGSVFRLQTTNVYNKSGDLISQAKADQTAATNNTTNYGTTLYAYDARGLLRMVTDATGQRSHLVYDPQGRKVGEVSAEGILTETVYNNVGQIVRTIRYNGKVDTSTLVDGSGNPFGVSMAQLRGAAAKIDLNGVAEDTTYGASFNRNGPAVSIVDASGLVLQTPSGQIDSVSAVVTNAVNIGSEILSIDSTLAASYGITVSYNAATATLKLSGRKTVANYQALLRTLKYQNSSQSASLITRNIAVSAWDGNNPVSASASVAITTIDNPIVLDLNGAAVGIDYAVTYTEGTAASTLVSPNITITDVDTAAPTLTGAVATLTNLQNVGAEILSIDSALATSYGITSSIVYSGATGTVTLSGTATADRYRDVLKTLKYQNTSAAPSATPRNVTIRVSDAVSTSALATTTITVIPVNTAPVLDLNGAAAGTGFTATYTEGSAATAIVGTDLTIADPDSAALTGATAQISNLINVGSEALSIDTAQATNFGITASFNASTGVLSLSGSSSVGNYQTLLRTLKYFNSSANPGSTARTINISVSDGAASGSAVATVTVVPVNNVPILDLNGAAAGTGYVTTYTENGLPIAIVGSDLTLTDSDSANMASASVQIANLLNPGAETLSIDATMASSFGVSASYNAATGLLTLSGSSAIGNYQSLLRTLKYVNSSDAPATTARTINISVSDGTGGGAAVSTVTITPINDAPTLDLNGPIGSGTGYSATYVEASAPVSIVSSDLVVIDVDSNLSNATAKISSIYDVGAETLSIDAGLAASFGIAVSYNSATGLLSMTGSTSATNYQSLLRTLKYVNSSLNPNQSSRTVTVSVSDGAATGTAISTVTINAIPTPPAIDLNGSAPGTGYSTIYTEQNPSVAIVSPDLTLTDPDSTTLSGASIRIENLLNPGSELLTVDISLASSLNIAVSHYPEQGLLYLSGYRPAAEYQAVLRTLRYSNLSDSPGEIARSIRISVGDGGSGLGVAFSTVAIVSVNDAPTLDLNGPSLSGVNHSASYTENSIPVRIVSADLALADDSGTIVSATAQIDVVRDPGAESLRVDSSLATGFGISVIYNQTTGLLTLSGSSSASSYQALLRTLEYANSSENPTASPAAPPRIVTVTLDDGAGGVVSATSSVAVFGVNDLATVDANGASTGTDHIVVFPSTGNTLNVGSLIVVDDPDGTQLDGAVITLVGHFPLMENISIGTLYGGITKDYSGGVLTLSGRASVADYQKTLRTLSYNRTALGFVMTNDRTIEIIARDTVAPNDPLPTTITVLKKGSTLPLAASGTSFAMQAATGSADLQSSESSSTSAMAAASVISSASLTDALNRSSYLLYDGAGRQVFSVTDDTEGFGTLAVTKRTVVETIYDGAGRVVKTVAYANRLSTTVDLTEASVRSSLIPDGHPTTGNDRTTRFFYSNDGLLLGQLDADGYLSENVYDAGGRVTKIIRYATQTASANWVGGTLDQLRPASNAPLAADDQTSYRFYDAQGRLAGSLDAMGYVRTYGYDLANNKTSELRYSGAASDASSLAAAVSSATAATPGGQLVSRSQLWDYDALNRVKSMTDAEGTVTRYGYDPVTGFLTEVETATARKTSYRYDAEGRVTQVMNGEGTSAFNAASGSSAKEAVWTAHSTKYFYDLSGRLLKTVDPNGNPTLYYYNRDGQLRYTVRAGSGSSSSTFYGDVTQYTYNAFNEVTTTTQYANRVSMTGMAGGVLAGVLPTLIADQQKDRTTQVSFTKRGLVAKMTDAMGNITENEYTAFGQLTFQHLDRQTSSIVLANRYDSWSYDRTGDLKSSLRDFGGENLVETYTSDAFGRQISKLDARSNLWSTKYDRLGRVVQTTDPRSKSLKTEYDAHSRVIRTFDQLNNATMYAYSDSAKSLTVTTPEGIVTTRVHNAYGEEISVSLANGSITETTTFAYDLDGRLTTKVVDPGSGKLNITTVNEYDKAGLLKGMVDANGVRTSYTYDPSNRIFTRTIDPSTYTKPDGTVVNKTGALNLVTEYNYNAFNGTFSVKDAKGIITEMQYDKNGNRTAVIVDSAGLKLATVYTYDEGGRTLQVREGVKATGSSGSFNVDGAALKTTQYEFDRLGRRTKEIVDPAGLALTTTYDYDANGNLSRKKEPRSDALIYTWYTYDASNRLVHTVDALGGVSKNDYDDAGRVIARTRYANTVTTVGRGVSNTPESISPTVSADYDRTTWTIYDRDGRIAYSVDPMRTTTSYTYDSAGRVKTEKRHYLSLGASVPMTKAGLDANQGQHNFDQATTYNYDAAGRLRSVIDSLDRTESYTYDNVGNRTTLTNKKGIQWKYDYDAANRLVEERSTYILMSRFNGTVLESFAGIQAIRYSYDALGNVSSRDEGYKTSDTSGAAGFVSLRNTQYFYDSRGMQTRTVHAAVMVNGTVSNNWTESSAQPKTQTWYDNSGNAIASVGANGSFSYKMYDVAGRLQYEVDAERNVTAYGYDANGNTTSVKRYAAALSESSGGSSSLATRESSIRSSSIPDSLAVRDELLASHAQALSLIASLSSADSRTVNTTYDLVNRKSQVTLPAVNYLVGTSTRGTASPTTKFAYNTSDELVTEQKLVNPQSSQWATTYFAYDKAGRVVRQLDAQNYQSLFEYDTLGRMVKKTEFAKAATGTVSNALSTGTHWNLAALTQAATMPTADDVAGYDRIVQYTYDKGNRITQEGVSFALFSGYSSGSIGSVTYPNGVQIITNKTYDALDNLTSVTDSIGESRTYYDALGRVDAVIRKGYLSNLELTTYSYDALGNVLSEKAWANGANSAAATSYSAGSADFTNDQLTTYRYDALGRVIDVTDALGKHLYRSYTATGDLAKEWRTQTDIFGKSAEQTRLFQYDRVGRLKASGDINRNLETGAAVSTDWAGTTYNAFGEVAGRGTDTTTYEVSKYDAAGRLWLSNAGDGINRAYEYDLLGQVTSEVVIPTTTTLTGAAEVASATGIRTRYTRDLLGRVVQRADPAFTNKNGVVQSPVINQTIDRWGNVLSVSDARNAGWLTEYRYNHRNQIIKETLPTVDVWTSTAAAAMQSRPFTTIHYDARGRQIGVQDARGYWDQLIYDAADRVVTEQRSNDQGGASTVRTITYDRLGRQVVVSENGALWTQTFDRLNQLKVKSTNYSQESYDYDDSGNRIRSFNNLANESTRYRYDTRGRLVAEYTPLSISLSDLSFATNYEYNVFGDRTRTVDANGNAKVESYANFFHRKIAQDTILYGYDTYGRLQLESGSAGAGGTHSVTYSYYANGKLKSITDLTNSTLQEYDYDLAGNRYWEKFTVGSLLQEHTSTFDSQNRMTSMVQSDNDFSQYYGYDQVGNRMRLFSNYRKPGGAAATAEYRYKYDAANRMVVSQGQLSGGDTKATTVQGDELKYDAYGNRESSRRYGGDADHRIYVYDLLHRLTHTYYRPGSGADVLIDRRTYDAAGRMTQYETFDQEDGAVDTKQYYVYNKNGWLLEHRKINSSNYIESVTAYVAGQVLPGSPGVNPNSVTNLNQQGYYDKEGNAYKYETWQASSEVKGYFNITRSADAMTRYRETQVVATNSANGNTGLITTTYDSNGNVKRIVDTYGKLDTRDFKTNTKGQVLERIDTDTSRWGPGDWRWQENFFANGVQVASFGEIDGAQLDFSFEPISEFYPSGAPGVYVAQVNEESLQSIAQTVYGDSRLWYLIADANGISSSSDIAIGMSLKIPNRVTNMRNASDTFQPYNPGDSLGSLSPTFKKPKKSLFDQIAPYLVLIATVIISYYVSETVGQYAGGWLATALGVGGTVAEPIIVGGTATLIGAAAGNAAGQATAYAFDLQNDFSWSSFRDASLTGALTGGASQGLSNALKLSQIGGSLGGFSMAGTAQGALSAIVGQGASLALNNQHGFSWSNLAAGAITGGIMGLSGDAPMDRASGASRLASFGRSFGSGLINRSLTVIMHREGKLDIAAIAADAFGNVIGRSLAAEAATAAADKKLAEFHQNRLNLSVPGNEAFSLSDAGGGILAEGRYPPGSLDDSERKTAAESSNVGGDYQFTPEAELAVSMATSRSTTAPDAMPALSGADLENLARQNGLAASESWGFSGGAPSGEIGLTIKYDKNSPLTPPGSISPQSNDDDSLFSANDYVGSGLGAYTALTDHYMEKAGVTSASKWGVKYGISALLSDLPSAVGGALSVAETFNAYQEGDTRTTLDKGVAGLTGIAGAEIGAAFGGLIVPFAPITVPTFAFVGGLAGTFGGEELSTWLQSTNIGKEIFHPDEVDKK